MNTHSGTDEDAVPAGPSRAAMTVVALALVLAALYAWKRPFTMDESFSMLEAIGQVPFGPDWAGRRTFASGEIWANSGPGDVRAAIVHGDNGNMAGYVLALRSAIEALGTASPLALAAVSIMGYGATVCGTWCLGRRLFGSRVGLVAAGLVVCHFGVLVFASMLRGNGWAMAAGLFATDAYLKIIGGNQARFDPRKTHADPFRRHLGAYAAWSIAGLFAHYLTALILAVHVAFALAKLRCRRTWARLAVAGTVVTLTVVPVQRIALASEGYHEVSRYLAYRERARDGLDDVTARSPSELVRACALAAQFMSGPYMNFPPLLAFPASLAVFATIDRNRRLTFAAHGDALWLTLALAAVAYVVCGTRLAMADSLFPMRIRYMLVSVPWFLMLMALALDRFGVFESGSLLARPAKTVATVYAIVAVSVPLVTLYGSIAVQKGDPHLMAARYLAGRIQQDPGLRVSVPTILDAQLIAFHLGPRRSTIFEIEDQAIAAEVAASIRRIGITHPVAVYYEFMDRYHDSGAEFRRPVLASDTPGRVRYVYRALVRAGE